MAKKKVKDENISIKEIIDELLETSIFKNIAKRNDKNFAQKLAIWFVRYILVISSMNESLKIDLEEILLDLHGEKFREILEITEKVFIVINEDSNHTTYSKYIL
jgi:arginyl-tRNA synthetase